jgi:hypothetical protein
MRYLTFIILFFLQSVSSTSQTVTGSQGRFPYFSENKIEDTKRGAWFLPYLTDNFSEFVSFTESSNWYQRGTVLSLAIKNDSAFIVTQTEYVLDTPKIYVTSAFLAKEDFISMLDSFKSREIFTLKDEPEIERCVLKSEQTLNGKKVVAITATTEISDGVKSLIIIYSKGKYRSVSYYELDEAKKLCPGSLDWGKAIAARDLIKSLFGKYQRPGKWRRTGMNWQSYR